MEKSKIEWIGEQIQSLELQKDDQIMVLESIKLRLNSLSEAIVISIIHYEQSKQYNPEGTKKVAILDSFTRGLNQAYRIIKDADTTNDINALKECDNLIKNSMKIIEKKESEIIDKVLGKDAKNQILNNHLEQSVVNDDGQEFWTTHIGLLNEKVKVDILVGKFYEVEFPKLKEYNDVKRSYVITKLSEFLSKEDGTLEIGDFNQFYQDIWQNPETRQKIINEILEEQDQPLSNKNQIMISILNECDLGQLLTKFMSMGLNSRSFLRLDLQSLQKIVTLEQSIKIYDAIQQHNDQLQKFLDIKSFLISVRDYAYGIRARYLANPREWEKGITGVCKLRWCICEAFNGKIYGPYIRDDEISYGFIVSWDPQKNYNPLNQYIANFGEPSTYKYKRLLMETYSYWDRDNVYTYQQVSNFEEAFVIKKKFDKEDEDYIRPYAHGPTLYRDKQGNQARIYYFQNHEVSPQEFEEKNKEDFMYPKFKKVTYKYN